MHTGSFFMLIFLCSCTDVHKISLKLEHLSASTFDKILTFHIPVSIIPPGAFQKDVDLCRRYIGK